MRRKQPASKNTNTLLACMHVQTWLSAHPLLSRWHATVLSPLLFCQTAEQQLPITAAAPLITRTPATITALVICVSISLRLAWRGGGGRKTEETNGHSGNGWNIVGQREAGNTFTCFFFFFDAFCYYQEKLVATTGRGRSDDCRTGGSASGKCDSISRSTNVTLREFAVQRADL